jgi:hypothetical protein
MAKLAGKEALLFSWLFLSTGIFALVGALFTWGEGWVFSERVFDKAWLPLGDLFVSAPLSFLAAAGLRSRKTWGCVLGAFAAGVYLLGSALVWIQLVWNGQPWPWQLACPPVAGTSLALGYFVWLVRILGASLGMHEPSGKAHSSDANGGR